MQPKFFTLVASRQQLRCSVEWPSCMTEVQILTSEQGSQMGCVVLSGKYCIVGFNSQFRVTAGQFLKTWWWQVLAVQNDEDMLDLPIFQVPCLGSKVDI